MPDPPNCPKCGAKRDSGPTSRIDYECGRTESLPTQPAKCRIRELKREVERLRAERDALTEALTPSGETRIEFVSEFPEIPWDTIAEIMAAIRTRAQERLSQ